MHRKVLDVLADNYGVAVSGEKIAEILSVSRNSVWKAVSKLREDGFEIVAVTNAGYKLISIGDNVIPKMINNLLSNGNRLKISFEKTVESTNSRLKELAEQGAEHGTVLIAQRQTGGKGRLGRTFHSPNGGLYMSILLRPKFLAEESVHITVAAAVAVAKAVESVSEKKAGIKWVNDIYIDSQKLCGILTEAAMDFESGTVNYAIVGIGINVYQSDEELPDEISEIAGYLFDKKPEDNVKTILAAEVLSNFMGFYDKLEKREYIDEYQKRSVLTGCKILFLQGNYKFNGIVEGINDKAELIVRLENNEIKTFSSGEVLIDKDAFINAVRNRGVSGEK